MLAYTGIETISNMSEEAKDPGTTVPKAINRVVIAVFAIYALLPAIALTALPLRRCRSSAGATGRTRRCSVLARNTAASQRTRCSASCASSTSG